MDEQCLQAPGDGAHELQAEAARAPSVPLHENVLMSLRVRSWPHSGQQTSSPPLPITISSKRALHFSHWYSKMGIPGRICCDSRR